ncbi:hypothetical protein HHL25_12800 [Rhizobium sp. S-51]|uniref:O-antigen ligase domain-containing protein n=1 Tax=Rhizobium terricola TaxID=2728849 RepID=A0A7Y0AWX9_9HYPH|nr:hypothetical protein [Rhizobium terricola]NML75004.1 hypothetical protein [Rhizobium terricola]
MSNQAVRRQAVYPSMPARRPAPRGDGQTWSSVVVALPLLVFAVPMGIGNSVTQPLSLLALLPYVFLARSGLLLTGPFLLLVVLWSAVQVSITGEPYSYFQLFRQGMPFSFLCVLLAGYGPMSRTIAGILARHRSTRRLSSPVDVLVYIFAVSQALQVLLFRVGIEVANIASFSEDGSRVLLYPTTSALLIFFYAAVTQRYGLLLIVGLTLLESGAKSILLIMGMLFVIALFVRFSVRNTVFGILSAAVLGLVISVGSPVAFERLQTFWSDGGSVDETRAEEIRYAQKTVLADAGTLLLGRGLMLPVGPGIPSSDPRWQEYSRFDVENGYWSMLAKVGLVGAAWFIVILSRMGFSLATGAVLLIWSVFSFKNGYQFFATFDGCYLVVWSCFLGAALEKGRLPARGHHDLLVSPWSSPLPKSEKG